MAKSITQLANDLKLSRSSIEARMNKIPRFRQSYTQKRGNRVLINQTGCRLVSQNGTTDQSDLSKNQSLLKVLRIQQQSNHHQYSIIQAESQTIHRLTRLLNQQQQLQLSLETENKDLRTQVNSGRPKIVKLGNSKPKHHLFKLNREKLRSFWRRFFGKD